MSYSTRSDAMEQASQAPAPLQCWQGQLVAGHGVASGRAQDSPYPAGTVALQAPHFLAHGIDLSPYQAATLNLDFAPGEWRLRDPDHHVALLRWTDRHPPETFSFWHCRLQRLAAADPIDLPALLYHPHPETKRAHHQQPSLLELLAPPLGVLEPGERFVLAVDPRRCRLIQPARLRARLLEFLKFRVLAAQQQFFAELTAAGPPEQALRVWLSGVWPEACDLSDGDLRLTLDQARQLYTEESQRGGP
ncbi:MAG: hypothetical protein ACKO5M_01370 [Vulcanococcus sp.]